MAMAMVLSGMPGCTSTGSSTVHCCLLAETLTMSPCAISMLPGHCLRHAHVIVPAGFRDRVWQLQQPGVVGLVTGTHRDRFVDAELMTPAAGAMRCRYRIGSSGSESCARAVEDAGIAGCGLVHPVMHQPGPRKPGSRPKRLHCPSCRASCAADRCNNLCSGRSIPAGCPGPGGC